MMSELPFEEFLSHPLRMLGHVQFSSIESALAALQASLEDLDVSCLSGESCGRLVDVLTPSKHRLDAALLALASRAVAGSQPGACGARSGAAWMAQKIGVSEKQARSSLAVQSDLAELPDVQAALLAGELSMEKAAVIAHAAEGNGAVASSLLDTARSAPVEAVQRKAREMRALQSSATRRQKLRESQFVHVTTDQDSMICGEFRLLADIGAPLLDAFRRSRKDTSWESTEAFVEALKQHGGTRSQIVFHLDVKSLSHDSIEIGEICRMKGVGPVPMATVVDVLDSASRALVGTSANKLEWFSEQDRRSTTKPLPDYVKRAIKAKAYDECEAVLGCDRPAQHVDHLQARVNSGTNDFENLGGTCEPHHHRQSTPAGPAAGSMARNENDERLANGPVLPTIYSTTRIRHRTASNSSPMSVERPT